MRYLSAILVVPALLASAACTPQEETAAVAGVSTACSLAAVGTTVYVQVAATGSTVDQSSAQLAQTVQGAACPVLVAQAQAAVTAINGAGQTATVTVSTAAPKSLRHVMRAKFKVRCDAAGQAQVTYVVKPDFVTRSSARCDRGRERSVGTYVGATRSDADRRLHR